MVRYQQRLPPPLDAAAQRRNGANDYRAEIIDPVAQTYNEFVTLDVNDRGTVHKIESRVPTKIFFPQEFLCLVEASPFEFVGWFNDFDLDAPVTPGGRHTVIIRKNSPMFVISGFG